MRPVRAIAKIVAMRTIRVVRGAALSADYQKSSRKVLKTSRMTPFVEDVEDIISRWTERKPQSIES